MKNKNEKQKWKKNGKKNGKFKNSKNNLEIKNITIKLRSTISKNIEMKIQTNQISSKHKNKWQDDIKKLGKRKEKKKKKKERKRKNDVPMCL